MKAKLLPTFLLALFGLSLYAQTKKCGTMQNLELMMQNDPTLKARMEESEIKTQEWLKNNGKLKYASPKVEVNKKLKHKNGGNLQVLSLCGYDNTYFTTITGPTILNQVVSPNPNCTYGGEYVTVTGLVAGNIYRVSTCGANNFDTQLSIYTAGGGLAVAHNDDWCSSQSEIYFNPMTSGDYDILIDEFNCLNNALCSTLEIELFYQPRPIVTIPVVFHIVHFGEAIGTGRNISTAAILSQINVMNEDFRRLNSDINSTPAAFRGGSDDALIEFCLAQQDEFGNPTTGIERILGSQQAYTAASFDALEKPTSVWDRDKYLNFWTCDINLSGYAKFPGGPASTDGVVVLYDQVGDIGLLPPFDLGRTATHEIGHWLDLKHIWGDAPGCNNDDLVNDTPLQDIETPIGTCPSFPFTDACSPIYPGIMFYNQMDYSGDACLTMFTVGQTGRMDAALFGPRSSLLTSQGCVAPIIAPPVVSFFANTTNICKNACVSFTVNSTNNPTSWSWSFPGGVPSTSINQNPSNICYNNPGTYNVTLTATNAGGSNSKTTNGYITVNTCAGINEFNQDGLISVYPNPSDGKFTIQLNSNNPIINYSFEVYNLLGDKIWTNENQLSSNNTFEIDLRNQSSGIYFLKVISINGIQNIKINIDK